MQTVTLTHSGWFGICPVLLAFDGEGGMFVEPRWWWVGWLLPVSAWLQDRAMMILSAIRDDYEPGWCAHGVRELCKPIVMELEG